MVYENNYTIGSVSTSYVKIFSHTSIKSGFTLVTMTEYRDNFRNWSHVVVIFHASLCKVEIKFLLHSFVSLHDKCYS